MNLLDPEASLILQKPTGQVVHQGGLRFNRESIEYRILRDWIAAGAPGPMRAIAALVRLEVTPREAVLIEPVDSAQLQRRRPFRGRPAARCDGAGLLRADQPQRRGRARRPGAAREARAKRRSSCGF